MYDDGDEEWVNLATDKIKLLADKGEPRLAAIAGSSATPHVCSICCFMPPSVAQ